MTNHEKKNFLRHKRDALVKATRKAFIRAQVKLEAHAKPEPDRPDLPKALAEFQRDRLREIDGDPQELPQELPRLPELLRAVKMFVQQRLSSQEYEALALAMFQQNRVHRDNPDQELSQDMYKTYTLAMVKAERKQQCASFKEKLVHKETRRRKKEQRKREFAAFDAT